ncbi:hypothetical protein pb186bvf_004243 [Paramecium bursaria]
MDPQKTTSLKLSQASKERVEAAKQYIEKKYSKLLQEEKDKREKWEQLIQKMTNLNYTQLEQQIIKQDILHREAELMRLQRQKMTVRDFEPIEIIGRGAFGEVRLCRNKKTQEVVAVKKMKKSEMLYKNQVCHVRAERDLLAASDNLWIVELKCSFQDEKYLYLVMEYLPGGDLMTLLMKKDIFTEKEAQFYMAESIMAVDSVHKLKYIHRDLKPDNILLQSDGHIKLSDFGLCKYVEVRGTRLDERISVHKPDDKPTNPATAYKRNRIKAYSTVGTPDYIAPEVFGKGGYSETADWWSLGAILFEMLVGYPPFFSEDPSSTCQKIINWKRTLVIPPEAKLSPAATDLITRLMTDANNRLGVNGVNEIKAHPFFTGIDWKKLREKGSPYTPEVKSEIDTRNFDKFEEQDPWIPNDSGKQQRKDVNFIGYTFNREIENQKSYLLQALLDLEQLKPQQTKTTTDQSNRSVDKKEPFSKSIASLQLDPELQSKLLKTQKLLSNNNQQPVPPTRQVIGQKLQQQLSLSPSHQNFNQYNTNYLKSLVSPQQVKKQAISPLAKQVSEHQNPTLTQLYKQFEIQKQSTTQRAPPKSQVQLQVNAKK